MSSVGVGWFFIPLFIYSKNVFFRESSRQYIIRQ